MWKAKKMTGISILPKVLQRYKRYLTTIGAEGHLRFTESLPTADLPHAVFRPIFRFHSSFLLYLPDADLGLHQEQVSFLSVRS